MTAFKVLQEKSVPLQQGPASSQAEDTSKFIASCCPAMDLVALANSSQLVVNRSIKWETLFKSTCNVTCLAWRPDGKALAAGQEDGIIVLYDVENGEEFSLPRAAKPHSASIESMYWAKEARPSQESAGDGVTPSFGFGSDTIYRDRASILMKARPLNISSNNNENEGNSSNFKSAASALVDMPLFGMENTPRSQLEILVSGDSLGVVTMGAFGYFPIGCIDLSGAFDEETAQNPPRVCKLCLSDDLKMLMAMLESGGIYRIVAVDTSVLSKRSNELRHVAAQCGHISEQIASVQRSIQLMAKTWGEGILALKKHIEPLVRQLETFERPNTPEQELFMMLTCGVTSESLEFYIKNLQESGLQKLRKTLDSTCASVEEVGGKSLLSAAQSLVFRLHDMLGLAEWKEQFEPIGLDVEVLTKLLESAQLMLLKVQEVLASVRDARANFAALSIWLQTVWKKDSEQGKILAQVDSERLVRLLSRDLLHPHITDQFKNAPLTQTFEYTALWTTVTREGRENLSLSQSCDILQSRWMKAFHMTSQTVSSSFRPLSNVKVCDSHPRLIDIFFSDGTFSVAVSNKPQTIMLLTKTCTNLDLDMKRVDLTVEETVSLTDLCFYNSGSLLLTYTGENQRRYIGQIEYSEEEANCKIERKRELKPSTWKTSDMICQGKRGIAVVFTTNRRLVLLDIEDSDDEEEEDDDYESNQ